MRSNGAMPEQPVAAGDKGEIDLSALMREIGRRKWLVVLATLVGFGLSTLAVNIMSPRFTAETRVFLEARDSEYTRVGRDGPRESGGVMDQDGVLSQVQIITSRDIARTIVERFELGTRPEFDPLLKGVSPVTNFMVMLGVVSNPASVSPQERVLESYFDKLKAYAMAKSRVVAIEFQAKDAELAARLSNAIAEEYIRHLEQAKRSTALSAGSWLARTIEELRQRVSAAEGRVEAYRAANGLFISRDTQTISTQQLSELNGQLATARSQQSDLASRARLIREAIRQGRIFEVSEIVNNDVVRRLIETRATLIAQIAQEERTLLPQHPRIKELQAQLGGLENQVRAAADRAARALESDARTAAARVTASQAELDIQKRQSGVSSEQEVQLRALEREAKAEREQLENYLSRYRDAAVRDTDNAVVADARIVQRATVPSIPTFPKRIPIIIIATIGLFTISLFFILTRALLSDRVYTRRVAEPVQAGLMQGYPPGLMPYPYMMMPAGMMPARMVHPGMIQPGMIQPGMSPPGMNPQAMNPPPIPSAALQDPRLQDPLLHEPRASGAASALPIAPTLSAAKTAASDAMQGAMARMREAMNRTPEPPVPIPAAQIETIVNRASAPAAAPLAAAPRPHVEVSPAQNPAVDSPEVRAPDRRIPEIPPAIPSLPVMAVPVLAMPASPVAAPPAPPMEAAPSPPLAAPKAVSVQAETPLAPPPPMDSASGYDPVSEIAEEAQAMTIRGRPVSLLVTGIAGGNFLKGSVQRLERALAHNGRTLVLKLAADLTPEGVVMAVKDAGRDYAFVIVDGGAVHAGTPALSRATTLTVLVASDDLEDKRTEIASQWLQGCNYFIIGAVAGETAVTA